MGSSVSVPGSSEGLTYRKRVRPCDRGFHQHYDTVFGNKTLVRPSLAHYMANGPCIGMWNARHAFDFQMSAVWLDAHTLVGLKSDKVDVVRFFQDVVLWKDDVTVAEVMELPKMTGEECFQDIANNVEIVEWNFHTKHEEKGLREQDEWAPCLVNGNVNISVRSLYGGNAEWKVQDRKLTTADNGKPYQAVGMDLPTVELKVKGNHDAFLFVGDVYKGYGYEVVLGGWGNSASQLRIKGRVVAHCQATMFEPSKWHTLVIQRVNDNGIRITRDGHPFLCYIPPSNVFEVDMDPTHADLLRQCKFVKHVSFPENSSGTKLVFRALAQAWYGDSNHILDQAHGRDVTMRLRAMLSENGTKLCLDGRNFNDILGFDPKPGAHKTLIIRYVDDHLLNSKNPSKSQSGPKPLQGNWRVYEKESNSMINLVPMHASNEPPLFSPEQWAPNLGPDFEIHVKVGYGGIAQVKTDIDQKLKDQYVKLSKTKSFQIAGDHDVFVFVGNPQSRVGFEIVFGGWGNSASQAWLGSTRRVVSHHQSQFFESGEKWYNIEIKAEGAPTNLRVEKDGECILSFSPQDEMPFEVETPDQPKLDTSFVRRWVFPESREPFSVTGIQQITRAWYGELSNPFSINRGADVTCRIRALVRDGALEFDGNQDMNTFVGKDTCPGVVKMLIVEALDERTLRMTNDDFDKRFCHRICHLQETINFDTFAEYRPIILQAMVGHLIGKPGRLELGYWLASQKSTAVEWILTNEPIMLEFIGSGVPSGHDWSSSFNILIDLIHQDLDAIKTDATLQRLAVATALSLAQPCDAWWTWNPAVVVNPKDRYFAFKKWFENGELVESFGDLRTFEMRMVVHAWNSDKDLEWLRNTIKERFPEKANQRECGDAVHGWFKYSLENHKGVSIFEGSRFYDHKIVDLPILLEYGGVCGSVGRFGSACAWAFGVPAQPVSQPGHCAFIYQREPKKWYLSNKATGDFPETGSHQGFSLPYESHQQWTLQLFQILQTDSFEQYCASEMYRFVALHVADESQRYQWLCQATSICPKNLEAWFDRSNCINLFANDDQVLQEIENAFHNFPQVWAELYLRLHQDKVDINDAVARIAKMTENGFSDRPVITACESSITRDGIKQVSRVLARLLKSYAWQKDVSDKSIAPIQLYHVLIPHIILGLKLEEEVVLETMDYQRLQSILNLMWDLTSIFLQNSSRTVYEQIVFHFSIGLVNFNDRFKVQISETIQQILKRVDHESVSTLEKLLNSHFRKQLESQNRQI